MPAYEYAPAPRFAAFTEFTCGHEELGHPVFLRTKGTDGAGSAYGSGCAAVLLYGRKDAKLVRRVVNEGRAQRTEAQGWEHDADRLAQHYATHGAPSRDEALVAYAKRNPSVFEAMPAPDVVWTNGTMWFGACARKHPAFNARMAELGWRQA